MPRRQVHLTFAYQFADRVVMAVKGATGEEYIEDYLSPGAPEFLAAIERPQKWSLLHILVHELNNSDLEYHVRKFPEASADYYRRLLESVGIATPSWLNAAEIYRHRRQLDRLAGEASRKVTDSTFQLLFGDREFLLTFQQFVAAQVRLLPAAQHPRVLTPEGLVRRCRTIPSWLRKAVFHRDKGVCQHCYRDLTAVINLDAELHLDHLLPLASGGTNDSTNFQLLCAECNLRKGHRTPLISSPLAPTYW